MTKAFFSISFYKLEVDLAVLTSNRVDPASLLLLHPSCDSIGGLARILEPTV